MSNLEDYFWSVPNLKCGVLVNWTPSFPKVADFEDSLGMTDFPKLSLEYLKQEP